MGWLGRSLGTFGSELGEGKDIALGWREREQRMAIDAARQKLAEMLLPLQIQQLKQQIAQGGMPQKVGITGTPGGGTAGVTFDPNKGAFGTQELFPGANRDTVKAQIRKMAEGVQSKEAQATLQAYADAVGSGVEDPETGLQKALQFMGSATTHADVTGRLKKGDLVPDKNSITGYSRQMIDGYGNVVKTVQNVVVPGLMPKVTEGWQQSQDEDGNIYLVPKTTVTRIGGEGSHASAGGATPGAGNVPSGSRVIGKKVGGDQKNADLASKEASQAYSVLNTAEEDYKRAQAGNPKASLALVFGAVRSMVAGAGRMTNVEIEQELKAGSFDQRLERWYTQAVDGTMPQDQMAFIMEVIRGSYEGKRKTGQQQYEFAYPGKALPPWLKPKEETNAPAGAPPPPPPPGFVMQPG
jgi:hypothetical protein